jgi:hypothetical protein
VAEAAPPPPESLVSLAIRATSARVVAAASASTACIAGLVGAPSHTHELAHFVQNVVNDRDAARQRVAELEQLLALRAQS